MTTARVLDGLVRGGFNGAATGATTATIGTVAMKTLGYLKNIPFSSTIIPSVLGTGLVGSLVFCHSAFYNNSAEKGMTRDEKIKNSGYATFILTGCGLLGQAILSISGNENPPLKELALALIIGSAALTYGTAYLSRNDEAEVNRPPTSSFSK